METNKPVIVVTPVTASAPKSPAPVAPKTPKTPKLTCNITGASRNTTREYLDSRLARLNISEAEFVANYANKDSIKLLREGKTVDQVRKILSSTATHEVSPEKLKSILALNGKQPKIKVVVVKPEATKTDTTTATTNAAAAAIAAMTVKTEAKAPTLVAA